MRHLICALVIIISTTKGADAQDPTFSQWQQAPLYFNPASTGDFDGSLRLLSSYRNQFIRDLSASVYRTGLLSVDTKLSLSEMTDIGIGLYASLDRYGPANWSSDQYKISTSIRHNFNKKGKLNALALGLNAGYGTSSVDATKLTWPSGIPEDISPVNYFTTSIGVLWSYDPTEKVRVRAGGGFHHLNRPIYSFIADVGRLAVRAVYHGSIELSIKDRFSMEPSVMYVSQGQGGQLTFGWSNKLYFNSEDNTDHVSLGLFVKTISRSGRGSVVDVYVLYADVNINSFRIGISYDRLGLARQHTLEFNVGYIFD